MPKTYEVMTPNGTRYCVERSSGMVTEVTPHEFKTPQIIDSWNVAEPLDPYGFIETARAA